MARRTAQAALIVPLVAAGLGVTKARLVQTISGILGIHPIVFGAVIAVPAEKVQGAIALLDVLQKALEKGDEIFKAGGAGRLGNVAFLQIIKAAGGVAADLQMGKAIL